MLDTTSWKQRSDLDQDGELAEAANPGHEVPRQPGVDLLGKHCCNGRLYLFALPLALCRWWLQPFQVDRRERLRQMKPAGTRAQALAAGSRWPPGTDAVPGDSVASFTAHHMPA